MKGAQAESLQSVTRTMGTASLRTICYRWTLGVHGTVPSPTNGGIEDGQWRQPTNRSRHIETSGAGIASDGDVRLRWNERIVPDVPW